MTKNVQQWIEISDFRAGIFSDANHTETYSKPSMYAPTGMATTDTYNCFAHPVSGALEPLPFIQIGASFNNDQIDQSSTPVGANACTILDAMVIPGHYEWLDSSTKVEPTRSDWFWIIEGRYIVSGGNSYYVTRGRSYKAHETESTVLMTTYDFMYHVSSDAATTQPASKTTPYLPTPFASMTFGRSSTTTSSCTPGDLRPVIAVKASSKPWADNTGTINSPWSGYTTFDTDIQATYPGYIILHPDPAAMTSQSIANSGLNNYVSERGWLISHQGRLVHVNNAVRNQFSSATDFIYTDQLEYTAANKWQVIGNVVVPDEGNPTGYGTGATFNANSLFLVKHYGGAVSIRGSLDNPQVVKLPAVESTRGLHTKGCMTPLGYVYQTPTGVWTYQDNTDSSKLLSLQVEAKSFDPYLSAYVYSDAANLKIQGWKGSLAYWHPFVMVPNNWLFDIRTQSWWRIFNPSPSTGRARPYTFWMTSPTSDRIYGVTSFRNTDSAADVVWAYADWSSLSPYYEWWSQNLISPAPGMLVQPTEVEIHVTASAVQTGTVSATCTFRGYTEEGVALSDTVIFSIPNSKAGVPMVLKANVPASSNRYAVMSFGIHFQNTDNSAAPTVTRIRLGVMDHSDIPYGESMDIN